MSSSLGFKALPQTPAAFLSLCRADVEEARALLRRLLAHSGPRGLKDTLEPYNEISIRLGNAASLASLFSEVHPDAAMREAAETATQEVSAFATELSLNRPLYQAVAAVPAKEAELDDVGTRWLANTLRDFRRAGVDKDDATRARIQALSEKMVKLGQTFDRAIREDVRSIQVTPEQLQGLPQDYIAAHPPGPDGKVTITTDYPDLLPFRTYAEHSESRRALHWVNSNRAYPGNEGVFKELLAARQEQAQLLGYPNWADYVTADKMIGSGGNIRDFVSKVAQGAEKRARADYEMLLARKRKDFPNAASVESWEAGFYEEKVKQEGFSFDSQAVRPYFEFARTQQGLLDITSRLFAIQYVKSTDAALWHEDVQAFDVMRGANRLGRIYLDLHPRPDKYKHAAQFPIVSGIAQTQLPEGALVCNFPNPKVSSPALMEHDDVVTLFHEFGHLMHHILGGHVRWASQSGVATEWDFVEAPSQMFEEWAWDTATLQLFARHVDSGEPIPAALVQRMRAANEFGKGTWTRTQTFYAELSRRYHTSDPASLDLTRTLIDTQGEFSLFNYVDGTHFHTSFGHLNGYSAIYYTYLWSLVISKDLFSVFKQRGLLDEETSHRYRDAVLARGGTRDAKVLIEDFLGRPYTFDAFEQWLNAKAAA